MFRPNAEKNRYFKWAETFKKQVFGARAEKILRFSGLAKIPQEYVPFDWHIKRLVKWILQSVYLISESSLYPEWLRWVVNLWSIAKHDWLSLWEIPQRYTFILVTITNIPQIFCVFGAKLTKFWKLTKISRSGRNKHRPDAKQTINCVRPN